MLRPLVLLLLPAVAAAAAPPCRFASLDGLGVHYQYFGEGSHAVVFIHGWTCDLTFWRGQAPLYQKRRSLLIDLPGHGASDRPPEASYSQELFARAVEAVMRDAGVEKATLVGHSMGGPVALTFARLYPAKTAAVVLVDAFVPRLPKDDAEREKALAAGAERLKVWREPDYKTAFAKSVDGMFVASTPEPLRAEIRTKMMLTPQHVVASAMAGMVALAKLRPEDLKFDVPALAISANRGKPRPGYEDYLRTIFPKLQGSVEMEGVGHFLMMEQPEKFNAVLGPFLERDASSR